MKAIGYQHSLPIDDPAALLDIQLPEPVATGHDLLVKVLAVAVNRVDGKVRKRAQPEPGQYKVLGWDAVGQVVAVGDAVSLFQPGDVVYYAGDLNRQGSNAQLQLVDERIVGRKPVNLSAAQAAAIPLTAITAWEMLFDHLRIDRQSDDILLVVGAAGGVGSILIQLAKVLTGATVVATAARETSKAWVTQLGADYVIDHSKPLYPQLTALGINQVTHVASLNHTEQYFDDYPELLAPFGTICLIDDPGALDVMKLKQKSQALHIEFMYARSMHQTPDMIAQHHLLNKVAELIEQGKIQTTLGEVLGNINAENLKAAHSRIESGATIGKLVLEGF